MITATDLFFDYPERMICDYIKNNKYNYNEKFDRRLETENLNISFDKIEYARALSSSTDGVKFDKDIKKSNYVIVNNNRIFEIKKIKNNIIYFSNIYNSTNVYPFYCNSNLKPIEVKNNKIYFKNTIYNGIDIEAENIKLKKITFALKDIKI